METLSGIDKATSRGLRFIKKQQLLNGSFDSFCTSDQVTFPKKSLHRTVFIPACIALALQSLKNDEVKGGMVSPVINKIAAWLMTQKSDGWSFNYWDRSSQLYKQRPLPDDLDDTFCALSVLWNYDRSLFNGEVLAHIAHILFQTEKREGGPYKTWLAGPKASKEWLDIDPAVNANIAYFLSLQDVELPAIKAYLEGCIQSNKMTSIYYPFDYPVLYFLARSYHGEMIEKLNNLILRRQKSGRWHNELNTALSISALCRNWLKSPQSSSLGMISSLQPSIDYLLSAQGKDGGWPARAFCIDTRRKGQEPINAGAASLTTALCLEALNLYKRIYNIYLAGGPQATLSQKESYYLELQKQFTKQIYEIENKVLRKDVMRIYGRIIERDANKQIGLLPYLVAQAADIKLEKSLLFSLSAINLWGWMAYTTYDDFLDNQSGPALLPAANYCLLKLHKTILESMPDNPVFQAEAFEILESIEAANAWEIANCRGEIKKQQLLIAKLPHYGTYQQLADRSLGHAIPALGVLYASGFKSGSEQVRALCTFFKNYLIARQLNDEAHDWEDDLKVGHVNAVAVQILHTRKPNKSKDWSINLEKDLSELRSIMWATVILDVCNQVEKHIKQARKAINQTEIFIDKAIFWEMLRPLEKAVEESRLQHTKALEFIKAL